MLARGSALSYVSRLALLGLVLSVAVLILVLSVVNGFERELRDRVLALLPDVTATAYQPIPRLEVEAALARPRPSQVIGAAAFVQGTVLLSSGNEILGATMTGIEPASYRAVTRLETYLQGGSLDILNSQRFGMVIGERLALRLGAGVGDRLLVVLPAGTLSPAGAVPRQRRFTVVDLLSSESQLDSQAVYVNLQDAQKFFRTGNGVHGVHVQARDLFNLDEAVLYLQNLWGQHQVRLTTWMRGYGNLYQAIAVQKLTMFILLSFLVGVAAFNLVSGLMMIVEQRRHDVAVLRTLGASSGLVVVLFVIMGLLLALFGIAMGLLAGGALAAWLPDIFAWVSSRFSLDLMSQYFIAYLPTDLRASDFFNVGAAALVLAVLAVIYPARRAAKLLPSRVLAHE